MAWKESYTTQTGDKRYRVGYRDAAGKKHSKSFIRSKDADAYMLEVTRREQLGHLYAEEPTTFGEFAGLTINDKGRVVLSGDGWFERYRASVRPSSFDRRKDTIKNLKELVPLRMDRISPALVEETVQSVMGFYPRQAKFVHDTIKMILRSASVRGQAIDTRTLEIKPPSYAPKRVRHALTLEELNALAEESDEPHLIRVAALTGLRQGELFALRDEDLDLDAGIIHVTGTVYKGKRSGSTKTKESRRSVHVSHVVVQELRRQLMRRPAGTNVVFPSPEGGYWYYNHFNERVMRPAVEELGLGITFHDLRHTYVSLMVEAGVHPKTISQQVGHRTIAMTMNVYAHVNDTQLRDAVNRLDSLFASDSSAPSESHSSEEKAQPSG